MAPSSARSARSSGFVPAAPYIPKSTIAFGSRIARRRRTAGDTAVVPRVGVDVREQSARLVTLQEGTTLDAVVGALNALGATPRDIIAIMQALKAAGALRAEIVIL